MKFKQIIMSSLLLITSLSSCNDNSTQQPTVEPTVEITPEPSVIPTQVPTVEPTVDSTVEPEQEIDSLKVLSIGNSFALDTLEYVPNIALNSNVKSVKFGSLYIGGCSIDKHYDNAVNNKSNYEYYTNEGYGWSSVNNKSILYALQSEQWDYISIQHGTGDGSRYADIKSYLNIENLIEYILLNVDYNPKIVFNMTWVGEKGSHEELINVFNNDTQAYYEAICDLTSERIAYAEGLDIVSPTGTAIQNARTGQLGSLTRDNYHLSLTTGRYTAGLTFFMAITGKDVSNIDWAPSSMTSYMKEVAIESACNAIKTPYSVTESIIEAPDFEWPTYATYGEAATPENPYYEHAAKEAPEVTDKIDLLEYFNILPTLPLIHTTMQSPNNMGLTIDLEKTPYLYYSFIVPEGSDFTFSIYSDTTYSPWLSFLDASSGNAKLNSTAETWDALYANNRKQYATKTQTGCIDLRDYAKPGAKKWIISMMKLYGPKGNEVVISYFFIGS